MTPRFAPGEPVRVADARKPGHIRVPHYAKGKAGIVERVCGAFRNPEDMAYGLSGLPKRPLYRVRFRQADLWPDYDGPAGDVVDVEIFEHWLAPL